MLRSLISPKCEEASRGVGGRSGFGHVLHHDVGGREAADEERSLIADHGTEPLIFMKSAGGSAGAGFLAESEVNSADDMALLVEILERRFHAAVEEHPTVDFDELGRVR